MSLWNPYGFTIGGAPALLGAAPPALRVMGGQATAEQLAAARMAFSRFCAVARTSPVQNPSEVGRLPDGTPYRIAVVGPQSFMEIWPVGVGAGAFLAWASHAAPQWERPLVAFPHDPYDPSKLPPRPEFNEPHPVLKTATARYWEEVTNWVIIPGVSTREEKFASAYTTSSDGEIFDKTYTGSKTVFYYPETGGEWYTVYEGYPWIAHDGGIKIVVLDGISYAGGEDNTTSFVDDTAYPTAVRIAEEYNANALVEYTAASAAWDLRYYQFRLELALWNSLKAAIDAGTNGPWWPVLDIRRQHRSEHLQAIDAYVRAGVRTDDPWPVSPPALSGLVIQARKLNIVLFEYEALDPFTGDWVWTTCPDLLLEDSIIISDAGSYTDTPRYPQSPNGIPFPPINVGTVATHDLLYVRSIRVLGSIQQTMTSPGGWTPPAFTPAANLAGGGWQLSLSREVSMLADEVASKIFAAMVIGDMAASEVDRQGAVLEESAAPHLKSTDKAGIQDARALPWPTVSLPEVVQLIAQALVLTRKIT